MCWLSQSYAEHTAAQRGRTAHLCPLWGSPMRSSLSLPGPRPVPLWATFRSLKWSKILTLLSVHIVGWISSPQGQVSTRSGEDEAAGIHTWEGSRTNPLGSWKLLDWLSISVRVVPLGPSVLPLPTWLKPLAKTKLKSKRLTIKTKWLSFPKVQVCMCTSVKDGEENLRYSEHNMIIRSNICWSDEQHLVYPSPEIQDQINSSQHYIWSQYWERKLIWVEYNQIQNAKYHTIHHRQNNHNQCVNWWMSLFAYHIWANN